MKNGRKPTFQERRIIQREGLDSREWLVIKVRATELEIRNRETYEVRKVEK